MLISDWSSDVCSSDLQYRKFNIKQAATDDDFAMMREVFQRRFARAQAEDPDRDGDTWPDLVLIDGGRGHLNAAKAVLEEMGIEDVCLVGVAQGPNHGREGREVLPLMEGTTGSASGRETGGEIGEVAGGA